MIWWGIGYYHACWQIFWNNWLLHTLWRWWQVDIQSISNHKQFIQQGIIYRPIHRIKQDVSQEAHLWKNMGWIQEVLIIKVSLSTQTSMHQRNPSRFSWCKHDHHNSIWDNQDTEQPGHGHSCRKDVLAQITSIIKNLADTNKILMEQVNTLMEIYMRLTAHSEHQKKHNVRVNTGN